jgi:hypothetical protein
MHGIFSGPRWFGDLGAYIWRRFGCQKLSFLARETCVDQWLFCSFLFMAFCTDTHPKVEENIPPHTILAKYIYLFGFTFTTTNKHKNTR